jgi:xylulose-5-phosphate/fructose-6-phosphate phosphoketolase
MTVLNQMSRYHLAMEAVKRVYQMHNGTGAFIAYCEEKLKQHHEYICSKLDDMPEIKNWNWKSEPEIVMSNQLFAQVSEQLGLE